MLADEALVAGKPEAENVLGEFDEQAVALHVGLLAQKSHQPVVAERQLVHPGGDVAQLPFGADFAEIHGEQAQKLFDQVVGRRDVGVQQTRDVPLDQVRVADENAADLQIDDERGNQPFGPARLHGDDFQPGADGPDVLGIDPHLPVRGGSLDVRIFKAVIDQLVDEDLHQRMGVLRENLAGGRDDAVDARAAKLVLRRVLLQEAENLAHEIAQVFLFLLLENQLERVVDFAHGADMDVPQPRRRHNAEEEIELDQMAARVSLGFFERVGHVEIAVDDGKIIRQRQKILHPRPRRFPVPRTERLEIQNQPAEAVVGKRPDQFQIGAFIRRLVGPPLRDQPQRRIRLAEPESVSRPEHFVQKRIEGGCGQPDVFFGDRPENPLQVGRTLFEEGGFAFRQCQESVDERRKQRQIALQHLAALQNDRVGIVEKVMNGAVLDVLGSGRLQNVEVDGKQNRQGGQSLGMAVVNVKIPDGDGLQLLEDKLPVDVGMVEFGEQFARLFLQTVVVLNNCKKRSILRRNLDLRRRALQIHLQRR